MKKVQILLMLLLTLYLSHLQAQYKKLGVMYCPLKVQGDYAKDFDKGIGIGIVRDKMFYPVKYTWSFNYYQLHPIDYVPSVNEIMILPPSSSYITDFTDYKASIFSHEESLSFFLNLGFFKPYIGLNQGAYLLVTKLFYTQKFFNDYENHKTSLYDPYYGIAPMIGFSIRIADAVELDYNYKYNFSVFPYIGEVKSFRFLSHNFSFLIILSK